MGSFKSMTRRLTETLIQPFAQPAPYTLPDRIPPPSAPSAEQKAPGQNIPAAADYDKIRSKYVRWEKLPNGEWSADWNHVNAPRADNVRSMLGWYTLTGVYRFPKVVHVDLMGRGRTNYFFLVNFEPHHRPGRVPQQVVLRLCLPVCPYAKLESEVATTVWAARVSTAVPRIVLFDPSGRNPLGLEWLMMEPAPGFPLQELFLEGSTLTTGLEGFMWPRAAPKFTHQAMLDVGRQLCDFVERTKTTAPGVPANEVLIGSLRIDWATGKFYTGPVVSPHFYSADRLFHEHANNGPFESIEAYLLEYIAIWYRENLDDEAMLRRLEDLTTVIKDMVKQVEALPEDYWPLPDNGGEGRMHGWPVTVSHADLHAGNVLVDEHGKLASIMGWENAVLMPVPLRDVVTTLDEAFQRFGLGDIIDPYQVGVEETLSVKVPLASKPQSSEFPCKDVSSVMERTMRCRTAKEAVVRALKEVCENVALRRDEEIRWIRQAGQELRDLGYKEKE